MGKRIGQGDGGEELCSLVAKMRYLWVMVHLNALGVKQCMGEVNTCALIRMTELGRYARVPLSERCFFVILWIWMWKHYFWI